LATLVSGRVRPSVGVNGDASQIAFSDDRGLWTIPADGSQPPRLLVQNMLDDGPATRRGYMDPRWHCDETQLLVTVGLYEGAMLGVVDIGTGAVTEVQAYGTGPVDGRWPGRRQQRGDRLQHAGPVRVRSGGARS